MIAQALIPLAQLTPLFQAVLAGMKAIYNLNWDIHVVACAELCPCGALQMTLMNRELVTGQIASNGFSINMIRATLAVLRFATVGIFQALKGLGALIMSFITGGATSAAFSATATAAFTLSGSAPCRPVVPWV